MSEPEPTEEAETIAAMLDGESAAVIATHLKTLIEQRDQAFQRITALEVEGALLRSQRRLDEAVKLALTDQLTRAERKLASHSPAADPRPCVHCGDARLSRPHLIAGGGHTFEAAS